MPCGNSLNIDVRFILFLCSCCSPKAALPPSSSSSSPSAPPFKSNSTELVLFLFFPASRLLFIAIRNFANDLAKALSIFHTRIRTRMSFNRLARIHHVLYHAVPLRRHFLNASYHMGLSENGFPSAGRSHSVQSVGGCRSRACCLACICFGCE